MNNIIKDIRRGDSLSVLFLFNPEYDQATLKSFKGFASGEDKSVAVGDGTYRMELDSEYTFGKSLITIEVEVIDENFGVRKQAIGTVRVNRMVNTTKSADVDKGAGIVVTVNVSDNVVTTDVALISYIKGKPFVYADFTPEQIADLKAPAVAAAVAAGQAVQELTNSLNEYVQGVNSDINTKLGEADSKIAILNQTNEDVVGAESLRAQAEDEREEAETLRVQAAITQAESEILRGQNETIRQTEEGKRITAEAARLAAGYITSPSAMQIVQLTQAQYDALPVKVATTIYLIIRHDNDI